MSEEVCTKDSAEEFRTRYAEKPEGRTATHTISRPYTSSHTNTLDRGWEEVSEALFSSIEPMFNTHKVAARETGTLHKSDSCNNMCM